jgi:solute:Na+ symporter, SSS family
MLVVAVIWAWFIDPKQLDRWVLFINSALVVFPLPLAWLKWFWWRTNVFGEMIGILGAFPVGYTVWFGSDAAIPHAARAWVHRISGVNLDGVVPAFGDLNRFPFWAGFTITFALGWIAILTTTLLTRPESMDVLRKFYRDVRPIGFWGPVKAELPREERKSINARARAEIIACCWGVACYFSMVLAAFSAFGDHFALAVLSGIASLATGAMFIRTLAPSARSTQC